MYMLLSPALRSRSFYWMADREIEKQKKMNTDFGEMRGYLYYYISVYDKLLKLTASCELEPYVKWQLIPGIGGFFHRNTHPLVPLSANL